MKVFSEQEMKEKAVELLKENSLVYATSDGNFFQGNAQGKVDAYGHSQKFNPELAVYIIEKEEEEKQPKKSKK